MLLLVKLGNSTIPPPSFEVLQFLVLTRGENGEFVGGLGALGNGEQDRPAGEDIARNVVGLDCFTTFLCLGLYCSFFSWFFFFW